MFLTEKHRLVPIFPSPSHLPPFSEHFHDAALSSRLLALIPEASTSAIENLLWLSQACELLSVTISDATSLLLQKQPSTSPSSLSSSRFLDSTSLTLLDSCNSVSAFCEGLLSRLLFVRFSLKSRKTLLPEKKPLPELNAVRLLSLSEKPPHGKIDSVQNIICAVEAVSALVIGAIWVTLSGKGEEHLKELKVDAEIFAWGKEFNKLLEAVLKRIEEEGSIDDQLEKITTEMVSETSGGEMEKKSFYEMEMMCEEMRETLEKLNVSMNAVFQSALYARNVAVHSVMIGAHKKC